MFDVDYWFAMNLDSFSGTDHEGNGFTPGFEYGSSDGNGRGDSGGTGIDYLDMFRHGNGCNRLYKYVNSGYGVGSCST